MIKNKKRKAHSFILKQCAFLKLKVKQHVVETMDHICS